MAKDINAFLLEVGELEKGTYLNPENNGVGVINPAAQFTSGSIVGNIVAGSWVIDLPHAYAEAKTGTPKALVRKDVIEQMFTFTLAIYDFTGSNISTFMVRRAQLGYVTTTPTAQTGDLIHIGQASPCTSPAGYLYETRDTSCPSLDESFLVGMYYGIITTEDGSITQDGDNYATMPIKLEATPHPNFTTLAQRTDNYGFIYRRTA